MIGPGSAFLYKSKNEALMDKEKLIKSYKTFYHITESENVESILAKGLLPNKYDDMDYHVEAPEKKAQICLTTETRVKNLLDQFNDPIVFEISADFISTLNTGLDWTFTPTIRLVGLDEASAIKKSIEAYGTLACFDPIPSDKIKLQVS